MVFVLKEYGLWFQFSVTNRLKQLVSVFCYQQVEPIEAVCNWLVLICITPTVEFDQKNQYSRTFVTLILFQFWHVTNKQARLCSHVLFYTGLYQKNHFAKMRMLSLQCSNSTYFSHYISRNDAFNTLIHALWYNFFFHRSCQRAWKRVLKIEFNKMQWLMPVAQ